MTGANPSASGKRGRMAVLAGVLLLLAASIAWNLYVSRREKVTPYRTKATDFVATWRCLACGHELEDLAGTGPRTCPGCGKKELYTSIRFACATHGVFRVAFNYDADGRPSMVKVADGPWVLYVDRERMTCGVVCPECGASLVLAEAPRPLANDEPRSDR